MSAADTSHAYVALGSNLGDSEHELRTAAAALAELCLRLERSSIYRTEPVGGPPGQGDYLNAVVALHQPTLAPRELLVWLLDFERRRGRVREGRWGPRVLDLDLIAFDALSIDDPELSLPHPRMHHRAFVLAPLCEVAPSWLHPDIAETACTLLERLPTAGVERTSLEW